jgi:uncharacterized protein YciI
MQTIFISILLLLTITATAQQDNPGYNKTLADSLGADEYGMKSYVLAILKTGPRIIEDKATSDSLFRGHMENIGRLANEGKLTVAGPLKKNDKNYRGIFILNVKTVEEAQALLASDPTVQEKIFEVELYQWYGSAALPLYLEGHSKIEKKKP